MKKRLSLVIILIVLLSMLLGACNSQPTTTPVPTEVVNITATREVMLTALPTVVPTEEPAAEEVEWSCENDPARNAIIDLGILGKYRPTCSGVRLGICFFYECDDWPRISPEIGFKFPLSKKGDVLTFTMPTETETRIFLNKMTFLDTETNELDTRDLFQFFINDEEWYYKNDGIIEDALINKDGGTVIPRGGEVRIVVLEDLVDNVMRYIQRIEFERNTPEPSVVEDISRELVADQWVCENDFAYGTIIDTEEGDHLLVDCSWGYLILQPTQISANQIKEREYVSFFMPEGLSSWVVTDTHSPVKVFVDGVEWLQYLEYGSNLGAIAISPSGEIVIPSGAKVEVYNPGTMMHYSGNVFFFIERNYEVRGDWVHKEGLEPFYRCSDEIQYGHKHISEETLVNLGSHGVIHALCDPKTDRWFLSFSEREAFVEWAYQSMRTDEHIDDVGGVIEFEMPAAGVVVYDASRFSPTGRDFTENFEIRYMLVTYGWVVLHINPTAKEPPSLGVVVYFFN